MNMSSMDTSMQGRDEQEYGRPNPNAPQELSRFAFLIGRWRCEARLKREDGVWETLQAAWVGRYVLDGYVIIEVYRMTRPTGELLVVGMNLCSYDVKKGTWSMKWSASRPTASPSESLVRSPRRPAPGAQLSTVNEIKWRGRIIMIKVSTARPRQRSAVFSLLSLLLCLTIVGVLLDA